jgi:hypothetical protein
MSTIRAMHQANCWRENISLVLRQLERNVMGPASQRYKSDAQIFLQLSQTFTPLTGWDPVQFSP